MVKLVDTQVSEACGVKPVGVRVSSRALFEVPVLLCLFFSFYYIYIYINAGMKAGNKAIIAFFFFYKAIAAKV